MLLDARSTTSINNIRYCDDTLRTAHKTDTDNIDLTSNFRSFNLPFLTLKNVSFCLIISPPELLIAFALSINAQILFTLALISTFLMFKQKRNTPATTREPKQ